MGAGTGAGERPGSRGIADAAAPDARWEWLEFDPRGRLVAVERHTGSALDWSARFDEFRDDGFPRAIALVFPQRDARARVQYDAVELVESLPDDLFVLQLAR